MRKEREINEEYKYNLTHHPKERICPHRNAVPAPSIWGERAWIYSYNQTFATSPVQSILEVSESGVVFETCNSIYRLSYTRVPMELEAMCA